MPVLSVFRFTGRIPLLSLAVFLMTCAASLAAPPPPQVETVTIQRRDIVPAREYVGHVEALQTVDLRARVEGFIEDIGFVEGDFVEAGKTLYVIEQAGYRARLAAEEARLAQARAELSRATSHLQRLQAVRKEGISATDLDNARAAKLVAEADLAASQAAVELAQLNLDYTTIQAPISGRIGRTHYTRGNLVNPSSGALATLIQVDPVRVVYSVSENDVESIRKAFQEMNGQDQPQQLAPRLQLANGEEYPRTGRIDFVDNRVDPATGTIAVRAEFANPDGVLISGQYVTVLVRSAEPKVMPVVPQAAVLVNQKGRYVLKVVDGIARVQPITIGQAVDGTWAVESGLSGGEQVIVSGLQKVQPEQPVTAVPAAQEN